MKVKIGEYLTNKQIRKGKKRKIKVKIERWDTWSLDCTLAFIILPALKKFKKVSKSSPWTDIEDFPPDLKCKGIHKRWKWVLGEMIFAFEKIVEDRDDLLTEKDRKRVKKGF